jgi:CRP/FNR family transcriptional regulator, cyclic AMP receptor protein
MLVMNAQTSDHRLTDVPLFAELPPATLELLARSSRIRNFPKGQIICSEGDPGDSLLVLERGRVTVSRFMRDGQEVVLSIVNSPAAFGELALIDGGARSATITAAGPVTIRLIERSAFLDALEREPGMAMALLCALTRMVRATNERLVDLQTLDVPARLAKWLLTYADQQPPVVGSNVSFTMSQSDLAAELGATRVSVNRALKTFERRGCIRLERDRIVLQNPETLRGLVLGSL